MSDAKIQEESEMSLINIINATGALARGLNSDAAHERILNNDVDDSINQLTKLGNEALRELKTRTGIQNYVEMQNYIQLKLKEQDQMWDRQWAELYQEGTVFKISGSGGYRSDIPDILETVRTYLPKSGTIGPNQIILVRLHGSSRYYIFDDREVPELTKLKDVAPIYQEVNARGIIKADEEIEKRVIAQHKNTDRKEWNSFTEIGTVFKHSGFGEVFETFEYLNLPKLKRTQANEVILGRSYFNPLFVEFTPKDLGAMEIVAMPPMYTKIGENAIQLPQLTLEKADFLFN